jgi:hypothetical protein
MRLQHTIGNRAVQSLVTQNTHLQRELTRQPPGRTAEPPQLTEQQVQDAIAFNNGRYAESTIRHIQDIVGAPVTGVVDEETIHMIVEFQADFRLADTDGKVGMNTLRPIVEEYIRLGHHTVPIWMIIDGHNLNTRGADVRFGTPTNAADNAETDTTTGAVTIGPNAFAQGYPGLVHTIAHELEHVRQVRAGEANIQTTGQFLAEAVEIMSVGMIPEGLAGFMNDAGNAVAFWNAMPVGDRRTHWARFQQVRNRVTERFNRLSAAQQATHQATMDAFNAVTAPPP